MKGLRVLLWAGLLLLAMAEGAAEAGEKQIVWFCSYEIDGTARKLQGVPEDCHEVVIYPRGGALSYHLSGVTTPTAEDGICLPENEPRTLGRADIDSFECINIQEGGLVLHGVGYAIR